MVRRWCVLLGVLLGLAAPHLQLWLPAAPARLGERQTGGQADLWRSYNSVGRLVELGIDSNFDGRSDVREYYDHGALIRRESDRNFDDQIDLVEEFDSTTHQLERSISDTDFDGTPDLLVLFHEGRPVFARQTAPAARTARSAARPAIIARSGDAPLAPLSDQYATSLTVLRTVVAPDSRSAKWTVATAFVSPRPVDLGLLASARRRFAAFRAPIDSAALGLRPSRGPPAA